MENDVTVGAWKPMNLYEQLLAYRDADFYPMHMPGHKRNADFYMENPYSFDVTEVEGTDNLHHPRGIIRELMDQMRNYYQTAGSYPLVNGSTCGVLAAISACCKKGDKILVDRCCHHSVYHAIYLLDLKPIYLYRPVEGETGIALALPVSHVREILEGHQDVSCVIITSPTYEGIVSDIRGIADLVHRQNIPLVIDEAHGAHLCVVGELENNPFPLSAIRQGADLVVQSFHKTLPALTQTGVLHICSDRVETGIIERYLAIYETSSPSYILMASIAQCMDWILRDGRTCFLQYKRRLEWFEGQADSWKTLFLWKNGNKEPSKWIVGIREDKMTGAQLTQRLRTGYGIETEMTAGKYILAMTSPCDTDTGIEHLAEALCEIDAKFSKIRGEKRADDPDNREDDPKLQWREMPRAIVRMSLYESMNGKSLKVLPENSVGEIAADYIMAYPPGIPLVVPGEEITAVHINMIREAQKKGLKLYGIEDGFILVYCAECS